MTRWERFRRWLRIWWQGECATDGCERGVEPMSDFCHEHLIERMRKAGEQQAKADFEREVRIHTEALRRVEAERRIHETP